MTAATRADPPVVDLGAIDDTSRQLWREAIAVMAELDGPWTLVGGLMVQLHATRHNQLEMRVTVDVDILADSRRRPSGTERIGAQLERIGFVPAPAHILRNPTTAFRFERDGVVVNLLAPDHGGERTPPMSVRGFQTLEAAGGTQALARSETVVVRLDDSEVAIRCPNLLGAILMKVRSVTSSHRAKDRDDLVSLLACVDDPIALQKEIKRTESGWLRRAERAVALDDPDLRGRLPAEQVEQARVAFRLLLAPESGSPLR